MGDITQHFEDLWLLASEFSENKNFPGAVSTKSEKRNVTHEPYFEVSPFPKFRQKI